VNLFSTNLLLHTLKGIVEEIEQVDPNHPALVQLKRTIVEKSGELILLGSVEDERARIAGTP